MFLHSHAKSVVGFGHTTKEIRFADIMRVDLICQDRWGVEINDKSVESCNFIGKLFIKFARR